MGGIFLHKRIPGMITAGLTAGLVTGLFGGGGGMVLVPLLAALTDLGESEIFPGSICVILPICLVSLALSIEGNWYLALPFLPGSLLGGILAGHWGQRIPLTWLHRSLGLLILWGGIRYLW